MRTGNLKNFGAIRNAETLEWIGMAPIYDSGSSLGYDKLAGQIGSEHNITCKPFKKYHEEQLKLVSSFEWIDIEKLANVRAFIMETFTEDSASEYIDEARMKAIADTVEKRIRNVAEMKMSYVPAQTTSTEYDVEKDIAEDYGPKMV